jgi:hypothetical protein
MILLTASFMDAIFIKNDMQGLVIKLRWQGYLIMN